MTKRDLKKKSLKFRTSMSSCIGGGLGVRDVALRCHAPIVWLVTHPSPTYWVQRSGFTELCQINTAIKKFHHVRIWKTEKLLLVLISRFPSLNIVLIISLHIRSMWETTVMHKQVSGWTVNFGPNFPDHKFTPEYPPISENFRFGMTKAYSGIPPPFQKTSDLGWPKLTPEYPPISEDFRFGMTKVYSGIPPPHFRRLQIWDDQSLLRNTPPFWKTSDLGWPKFTPEYPPPISENFRFGMTKVYSGIPPHFGKLQIWDDQSLLQNTPPPISENFRFGMIKVYSGIPPPFQKTSDLGWPKFTLEYPPPRKLSESPDPRFSQYRDLLHVVTLSNLDNY